MKDLYKNILDIYLSYNFDQIYQDRSNIKKIIDKIYENKLRQYFIKIEEFFVRLIFLLIYRLKNDNNLHRNISNYLYILNFRDYINEEKINICINFNKDLIDDANTLINFKCLAMQEDYTNLDFENY